MPKADNDNTGFESQRIPGWPPADKGPKPPPQTTRRSLLAGIAALAAAIALAPALGHAQHRPCVDGRTGLRMECSLPYGEREPLLPPGDYVNPQRWPAPHGRHDRHDREPDDPRPQWRT